ncbi:MAG: sugar phosphate isomerase/epimerase [Segetibacter sp.]
MKNSRRNFIQKTAVGMAGSVSIPFLTHAAAFKTEYFKKEPNLPIGVAGYTFAKFDVDTSIAMMKRLDIHYMSIKDMHLPLNSSDEKIKEVLLKYTEANIKIYTAGVIYMKTKQEVDTAFDYAKKVGVNMIVGVPPYDLLDYTEQKVKAMDIKIAIHNHGPEDKLYPGPQNVYDHIKNRDQRMGLCLDIGHATRAGANPGKAIIDYKDRLFDLHIKDVTGTAKDAKAIEIGRGVIDFNALINALNKINYKGICSIEFEKDMTDPLPGIAESTGFFRGVLVTVG